MTSNPVNYFAADNTSIQQALSNLVDSSTNRDEISGYRTNILERLLPLFRQNLLSAMLINTAHNTSQYVKKDMDNDLQDARDRYKKVRTALNKTRYAYLQKRYGIGYNGFVSGVFQGLMLIAALSGLVIAFERMGKISMTLAAIIISIIALIYLIIVAIIAKNNSQRRTDDWNKFNFRTTA